MQTAVDWLFNQLWNTPKDKLTWFSLLEQANKIFEQQIIDAHGIKMKGVNDHKCVNGEQYYNQTYGSKNITLQNQSESKVVTELSDEEIHKAAKEYDIKSTRWGAKTIFIDAVKWYREQLKNR